MDVREFQDTFWTFPQYATSGATAARSKPVPGEAHYLSLDIEVDPARLQGDDVLQLFEDDGTLRGTLLRQWTGWRLQPSAQVVDALLDVSDRDRDDVRDDPDDIISNPIPKHRIRAQAKEHVDVFHRSVTLRLHRALPSDPGPTAPSPADPDSTDGGPVFTARWSAFVVCPDGFDTDDDGGCSEKPSRIEDTPWILVIVGVPGLALVGLTLLLMGPRSWRMHRHCPSWCHGESRESRVKRLELERAQRHMDRQNRVDDSPATIDGQKAGGQVCGRQLEKDVLGGDPLHEQDDPIAPVPEEPEEEHAPTKGADTDGQAPNKEQHGATTATAAGVVGAIAAAVAGTRDVSHDGDHSDSQSKPTNGVASKHSVSRNSSPQPQLQPQPNTNGVGHGPDGDANNKPKRLFDRQSSSRFDSISCEEIDALSTNEKHASHQLQSQSLSRSVSESDGRDRAMPSVLEQTLDRVSGIGPLEHEWSRRLKRELGRTLAIFLFELSGTFINWWFAAEFIEETREQDGTVFSDPLAASYLAFGILATLGALVNAWSRLVVMRSLILELRSAHRLPPRSSHRHRDSSGRRQRRPREPQVAPAVELAFLERKLHHLKVVCLTLVVESLPFACLGFTKLYRYNSVRYNTLLLVSCAVSAFWVGSKVTRLIGIGELMGRIRSLEREEEEEEEEAAEARKQRKRRDQQGSDFHEGDGAPTVAHQGAGGEAEEEEEEEANRTDPDDAPVHSQLGLGSRDHSLDAEGSKTNNHEAGADAAVDRSPDPTAAHVSDQPDPGAHPGAGDAAGIDGVDVDHAGSGRPEVEASRSDSRPRFHEDSTSVTL